MLSGYVSSHRPGVREGAASQKVAKGQILKAPGESVNYRGVGGGGFWGGVGGGRNLRRVERKEEGIGGGIAPCLCPRGEGGVRKHPPPGCGRRVRRKKKRGKRIIEWREE